MMTILILYATTEGQTRKIARHAATYLTSRGLSVELLNVTDAEGIDLSTFDAVILAASVHMGRYQGAFTDFVAAQRDALARTKHAFLSVSLAAASPDKDDLEGIAEVVQTMITQTGWTPASLLHVAGAFRFSQYDFLKTWAMRWIASKKDPGVDRQGDTEYTDWAALDAFLDGFATARTTPAVPVNVR